MRIVIDMQGAQTESRYRGIGRYSTSLAKAMLRNAHGHEIWVVLNGLFQETVEPIRASIGGLLPQHRIRVFEIPGPVAEISPENASRARAAEMLREAFIADLKPDVVHVMSLFEGFIDDACTSIGALDYATPVAVTLYDLIPLIRKETSFANEKHRNWYHRKLQSLKRAGLLLAISESSRREGISALHLAESRVVNVSTAADECFRPLVISAKSRRTFLKRFGIPDGFVLYMGGWDERKNVDRLIRAYAHLSPSLRRHHSLVLAGGRMPQGEMAKLQGVAQASGLRDGDIHFTDGIRDEDLAFLYNLCSLFVFPSLHEGFGLPVLEAMSCGAATIASDRTSLPEVIGRSDALFDPEDVGSMAAMMARALTDRAFRTDLRRHGLSRAQRFTWDASARAALSALEMLHGEAAAGRRRPSPNHRYRMAYVSPLPPEKSGISDYSAELLPELSKYYTIDVVSDLPEVSDSWVSANFPLRPVAWFAENANRYDRILYQMGNSPFHAHMFELLRHHPGVVTLHDFFLSSVRHWMDAGTPGTWTRALFDLPEGYRAVRHLHQSGWESTRTAYPCNADVFEHAIGVVAHSQHNVGLARRWFGEWASEKSTVIPQMIQPPALPIDRDTARSLLGLHRDDIVVCSFGMMDSTKLNHRLLNAWRSVVEKIGPSGKLVFVGASHGGEYGSALEKRIRADFRQNQVQISGFVTASVFQAYLSAADAAVQLRTNSRGETSRAVLDCLAHGLPTVINGHGTAASYPEDAVVKIPDEFDDGELAAAVILVCSDLDERVRLSKRATEYVKEHHHPETAGAMYHEAVERFYSSGKRALRSRLAGKIASVEPRLSKRDTVRISECVAVNHSGERQNELLLDVTATAQNGLRTGIERVARSLAMECIAAPPAGYRVEPVYLTDKGGFWHYRYARKFTCELLGTTDEHMEDDNADPVYGDVLVGLDISSEVVEAERSSLYRRLRNRGVGVSFVVFDLLPVTRPEFFPPGADEFHAAWLEAVARAADSLLGISKSTADDLDCWLRARGVQRHRSLKVGHFHLGADIESSAPSTGIPADGSQVLAGLRSVPTFLVVGTIEPRKGHLQAVAAFEMLWEQGVCANLAIVGHEGWKVLPDSQRRTIPAIVKKLRSHPESGRRLFWLEGISDEYLEMVYSSSVCLIAPSEGEGFGLPIVEAARRGLQVIARGIPVFREIAGGHAHFFAGSEPGDLGETVKTWLVSYAENKVSRPTGIGRLTWKQSAEGLLSLIIY